MNPSGERGTPDIRRFVQQSLYHYMSAKHLHRYIKEFSFRHNTAKIGTMDFIGMTIDRMADKRLTYRSLINA